VPGTYAVTWNRTADARDVSSDSWRYRSVAASWCTTSAAAPSTRAWCGASRPASRCSPRTGCPTPVASTSTRPSWATWGATYAARDAQSWSRLTQPQRAEERRANRQLWDDLRRAKELLSRTASTVGRDSLGDGSDVVGLVHAALHRRAAATSRIRALPPARSPNFQSAGTRMRRARQPRRSAAVG
jgi:hypothetical protein